MSHTGTIYCLTMLRPKLFISMAPPGVMLRKKIRHDRSTTVTILKKRRVTPKGSSKTRKTAALYHVCKHINAALTIKSMRSTRRERAASARASGSAYLLDAINLSTTSCRGDKA